MTPEERENAQIIYGLSLQPPIPKDFIETENFGYKHMMVTCPECKLRIREVGYAAHWSKAHRQRHQLDYFKRWKKEQS